MSKKIDFLAVCRIYLGLYLISFFIETLGSANALWSNEGLVTKAEFNLTYGVFPNLLNYFDEPFQVGLFIIVLTCLSISFVAGKHISISALLLWYGIACLLNRNNLILNPSLLYMGWLLLAFSIIPKKEFASIQNRPIAQLLVKGAWFLFAFGYFFSGVDKLHSESWVDGSALYKILSGPMARTYSGVFINNLPAFSHAFITWSVILLELACLPLSVFSATRKFALLMATFLQFAILVFLSVAPIALGMLSFHLFLMNNKDLESWSLQFSRVLSRYESIWERPTFK